jgi:hypothetical protein
MSDDRFVTVNGKGISGDYHIVSERSDHTGNHVLILQRPPKSERSDQRMWFSVPVAVGTVQTMVEQVLAHDIDEAVIFAVEKLRRAYPEATLCPHRTKVSMREAP